MRISRPRLCALLPALLAAAPAHAAPVPGGEVHVERSDRAFDCPNEAELVRAALALGSAPAVPGATPISIAVRFDREPSSYVATVSSSGQKTGERVLRTDDADCKRLADSVAVVLALLLDLVPPEAAAPPQPPASAEPGPEAVPPVPAPAPTTPAPVPEAARAAPAASPVHIEPPAPFVTSVRAEGALAYGLLGSAVSPYVGGAVTVARGPVAVALGGDWVVPRAAPVEHVAGAPNARVRVGLAYGYLDGCFLAPLDAARSWNGAVCARFAAGVFSGDGRGFDHHFPQHDAWFAAGPVAGLRYHVTRAFSLRLDALALVALGHQRFLVTGYGTAFRSSFGAAGVAFGPELSIW